MGLRTISQMGWGTFTADEVCNSGKATPGHKQMELVGHNRVLRFASFLRLRTPLRLAPPSHLLVYPARSLFYLLSLSIYIISTTALPYSRARATGTGFYSLEAGAEPDRT